jgi:hypothetical protein
MTLWWVVNGGRRHAGQQEDLILRGHSIWKWTRDSSLHEPKSRINALQYRLETASRASTSARPKIRESEYKSPKSVQKVPEMSEKCPKSVRKVC